MVAFQLIAILAISIITWSATAEVDTKKYSYMCLEYDQDLCLGISPGTTDPVFDINNVYRLQVKSRSGGESSNTDYKKTRWDLGYGDGRIALSRFKDLCAVKIARETTAALYPCNSSFPATYSSNFTYGRWALGQFTTNTNGRGVLQLSGQANQCLTVMQCQENPLLGTCTAESEVPAWNFTSNQPLDLRRGAYVRFRSCYNRNGDNNATMLGPLQIWRQQLDCAIGCIPSMLEDGECQQACNNVQCKWDGGDCITKAPTPPTRSPTKTSSPVRNSTPGPTKEPTTLQPSSSRPTTNSPSRLSQTATPTYAPSGSPTMSPTVACPLNGTLEFCGRFLAERGCNNTKLTGGRCQWCLNQCLPNQGADKRVCQIAGFFSHCNAECPTTIQRRRCQPTLNGRKCLRFGRGSCIFCPAVPANSTKSPVANRCFPGKDRRVCSKPDLLDHCGTLAPTLPKECPPLALATRCLANRNNQTACNRGCVWCPSISSLDYPCRPTVTSVGKSVCEAPGNPIYTIFSKCTALFPKPTRSPILRPTKSPVRKTGIPSKSPVRITAGPTKRPTVAIPKTQSPTKSPVRTTASPTKRPTIAKTQSPTRVTKSPTVVA